MRFMGEHDDVEFLESARRLATLAYDHGLRTTDRVLDVGSGYGRLAIGLMGSGFTGRYLGFDILARHVTWCSENLTTYQRRYRFRHLDVRNDRYNPSGAIDAADARFPARDRSRDTVVLFSVFTHLYEADIRRYLAEIRRVLVPGGRAITTWFVFTDARLAQVTSAECQQPMTHVLDEHTRFAHPEDPLWAISYERAFAEQLVREAGLRVAVCSFGTWAGEPSTHHQDLLVLRRPMTLRDRLGRIKRALGRAVSR
jgi:SAM-dependent methyltransferase